MDKYSLRCFIFPLLCMSGMVQYLKKPHLSKIILRSPPSHCASGLLNRDISLLLPKPILGCHMSFCCRIAWLLSSSGRSWKCVDKKKKKEDISKKKKRQYFCQALIKIQQALAILTASVPLRNMAILPPVFLENSLLGIKYHSCYFHLQEDLPFAASSRRARLYSLKQWKLVKFVPQNRLDYSCHCNRWLFLCT